MTEHTTIMTAATCHTPLKKNNNYGKNIELVLVVYMYLYYFALPYRFGLFHN